MSCYVGLTDDSWYYSLRSNKPDEVNFWQPRNMDKFSAIKPGELFLFKLHKPHNYIVGGGIFTKQVFLPIFPTWDAFTERNGVKSLGEFTKAVFKYRSLEPPDANTVISSLIISQPFFLNEEEWIPAPQSWAPNIVKGKSYRPDEEDYKYLMDAVQERYALCTMEESNRFGNPLLVRPRLGQGAFRLIVTDAYNRRCAITGEKTLPVLDAAHIKSYKDEGPHELPNGILLRQDFHTLFDKGFITITPDKHIEVSRRIKDLYGNGKEYYGFHGKSLLSIPGRIEDQPGKEYLAWHNNEVFIDSLCM